jgi:hypothetical protein
MDNTLINKKHTKKMSQVAAQVKIPGNHIKTKSTLQKSHYVARVRLRDQTLTLHDRFSYARTRP